MNYEDKQRLSHLASDKYPNFIPFLLNINTRFYSFFSKKDSQFYSFLLTKMIQDDIMVA